MIGLASGLTAGQVLSSLAALLAPLSATTGGLMLQSAIVSEALSVVFIAGAWLTRRVIDPYFRANVIQAIVPTTWGMAAAAMAGGVSSLMSRDATWEVGLATAIVMSSAAATVAASGRRDRAARTRDPLIALVSTVAAGAAVALMIGLAAGPIVPGNVIAASLVAMAMVSLVAQLQADRLITAPAATAKSSPRPHTRTQSTSARAKPHQGSAPRAHGSTRSKKRPAKATL